MRITCPSCDAEYDLPGPLPQGRIVRCVRCGGEWAPVPLPPVLEPAAPAQMSAQTPLAPRPFMAVPPDARPPIRTPEVRTGPRRAPLVLAWLASAVLLAALVAASYVFREPIMQAWPPSTRAYAALGLA